MADIYGKLANYNQKLEDKGSSTVVPYVNIEGGSIDADITAIGAIDDAAVVNPSAEASAVALLKGILQQFTGAAGITVKRAAISASTSGDNTLVAAVASKKIKVLGLVLVASDDVDVRLESGAGGTALTGVISLAVDGNGFVFPMTRPGFHWIETAASALLNLELSAAVQVSGNLVYYEEA